MKLQLLNFKKTQIQSNLYGISEYADSEGRPLWHNFVQPHFNEIGAEIVYQSFEELDKDKPWIINVQVQGWTWYSFEGDIISEFSEGIQNELINGSAYLLLNHEWECHTYSFLVSLYKHLKNTKLPPNKIIYLCNAVEVDREFARFNKNHAITKENQITVIHSMHLADAIRPSNVNIYFECDQTTVKSKMYLCLNRVGRQHRLMLVGMLSFYDLLDYGYVSLGVDKEFNVTDLLSDPRMTLGYEKIKESLPLIVDTSDFERNHVGFDSLPKQFYQDSYFSLVTGTEALAIHDPSVSITEKEMKPMLAKHPFILLNKPGILRYMRNLGFLTFDKWFDESYDTEIDDIERVNKIALEVKRLSLLSHSEWDSMLKEMHPVLLHNYNRVVNYASERNFFSCDLKKLIYYVS